MMQTFVSFSFPERMKKTFFHGDKTVADDEDVTKNLNLYFHTAVNSVGINKNKSSDRDRKFG